MPDQLKNALIGIFVAAALAIMVFIILFLHPQTGNERQVLHVRFANIDKVNVGTRVNFAGRPVGEVSKIEEITAPRPDTYHGKYVYIYDLTLRIDSGVEVYNSDEISLRTSGLLGEKSVSIMPKIPKKGEPLVRVTEENLLYSVEAGSIEDTLAEISNFAERAETLIDSVVDQLNEIKDNKIWVNFGKTAENLADITTALNMPENWDSMLTNFTEFSQKANDLATEVTDTWDTVDEAAARLASGADSFSSWNAHADFIIENARQGHGSFGELFMNDTTYLQVQSVMSKAETLMDDINHYGVLFHLDKGWQRLRARRLNLMQKLECPQEFRNFFEDEIDQINTSLARVHMVLDDTYDCYPPEMLMCDCEFADIFADLMRRVQSLEENIRLYNQQLMDEHEKCCR